MKSFVPVSAAWHRRDAPSVFPRRTASGPGAHSEVSLRVKSWSGTELRLLGFFHLSLDRNANKRSIWLQPTAHFFATTAKTMKSCFLTLACLLATAYASQVNPTEVDSIAYNRANLRGRDETEQRRALWSLSDMICKHTFRRDSSTCILHESLLT